MHFTTGLFKVTGPKGESINGGKFKYGLPTKTKGPGAWTPIIKDISCCSRGYHLTTKPTSWFKENARLWVAEGAAKFSRQGDKLCFNTVRLLEEVKKDWPYLFLHPNAKLFLARLGKLDPGTVLNSCNNQQYSIVELCANLDKLAGLIFENLRAVSLGWTSLPKCTISTTKFNEISFNSVELNGIKFIGCSFINTSVYSCNFTDVSFTNCNLNGLKPNSACSFKRAKFYNCNGTSNPDLTARLTTTQKAGLRP